MPIWFATKTLEILFYQTYTHTRLTSLCPRLPGWAATRKVKPISILLKQETVSGSGISWAICKSTPRSRQINHSSTPPPCFLQARCPSCRPTNSVKALKAAYVNQTPQKRNWSKLSCCGSSHLLSHVTQPVSVMGKTAIPSVITTTSIFCLSIRWLFFSESICFVNSGLRHSVQRWISTERVKISVVQCY